MKILNSVNLFVAGSIVPGDHPAGHAGQPPGHCQCVQDQEPQETEGLLLCSVSSCGRSGRNSRIIFVFLLAVIE